MYQSTCPKMIDPLLDDECWYLTRKYADKCDKEVQNSDEIN